MIPYAVTPDYVRKQKRSSILIMGLASLLWALFGLVWFGRLALAAAVAGALDSAQAVLLPGKLPSFLVSFFGHWTGQMRTLFAMELGSNIPNGFTILWLIPISIGLMASGEKWFRFARIWSYLAIISLFLSVILAYVFVLPEIQAIQKSMLSVATTIGLTGAPTMSGTAHSFIGELIIPMILLGIGPVALFVWVRYEEKHSLNSV